MGVSKVAIRAVGFGVRLCRAQRSSAPAPSVWAIDGKRLLFPDFSKRQRFARGRGVDWHEDYGRREAVKPIDFARDRDVALPVQTALFLQTEIDGLADGRLFGVEAAINESMPGEPSGVAAIPILSHATSKR
jgi:hypothetical protein